MQLQRASLDAHPKPKREVVLYAEVHGYAAGKPGGMANHRQTHGPSIPWTLAGSMTEEKTARTAKVRMPGRPTRLARFASTAAPTDAKPADVLTEALPEARTKELCTAAPALAEQ
eukprot:4911915-Amphidinium_carterae.1